MRPRWRPRRVPRGAGPASRSQRGAPCFARPHPQRAPQDQPRARGELQEVEVARGYAEVPHGQ
eukprot:4306681-Pyramimonas_sp.AAC.1